ncbi:MAG: glucuronate isomerase [Planctomycetota bacterium]
METRIPIATNRLAQTVRSIAESLPIVDMHTHLYAPAFGSTGDGGTREPLLLWGIDELLAYHYFVDEVFRVLGRDGLTPERFWAMPLRERADLIWQTLFVERPPVSEACVGLVDVLVSLGLEPREATLDGYRSWFASRSIDAHVDEVMRIANVRRIVMTNEPFSDLERPVWLNDASRLEDPRFAAVLRIDPLIEQWGHASARLREWGFGVDERAASASIGEVRRFLNEWIGRIKPEYLACSLSPEFCYEPEAGDPTHAAKMFDGAVIPAAIEHGLSVALMIGARRAVHPEMQLAGDGLGRGDVDQLIALARTHPDVTFLVTMLSRENQHELCVAARKFANIVPFGCWWYLNTASQIGELTTLRFELLGTSFIPQHSDSRVLEQLVYKWKGSRAIIADCLTERYTEAVRAGAVITEADVRADIRRLFETNYTDLIGTGPR